MRRECCVWEIYDDGQRVRLYGWTDKPLRVGDYVVLATEGRTTRYRLTELKRPLDPKDQWFGYATFAPRGVA
jgi:hypothetical protein